jgi:hypothetical protein
MLAVLLGVAVATAVWLLRGRDCDWYQTAATGTMGGAAGVFCVMWVMPIAGVAEPYPLKPAFIASAVGAVIFQLAYYSRARRRP